MSDSERLKHNIYLKAEGHTQLTWELIDEMVTQGYAKNRGALLEYLYDQYLMMKRKQDAENMLTETIQAIVHDELAEQTAYLKRVELDPIRVKAQYTDKLTQAMWSMANGYISKHNMDVDDFPVMEGGFVNSALTAHLESIQKMIKNRAVRKHSREVGEDDE